MVAINSIRRYSECMPDIRVVKIPIFDHGLGGEIHGRSVRKVVFFLREAQKGPDGRVI